MRLDDQEHDDQPADQHEGDMLGGGATPRYAAPFMGTHPANNIVLGGGGSDLLQGRGGDDYLDGDAALDVYLVGPNGEKADSM